MVASLPGLSQARLEPDVPHCLRLRGLGRFGAPDVRLRGHGRFRALGVWLRGRGRFRARCAQTLAFSPASWLALGWSPSRRPTGWRLTVCVCVCVCVDRRLTPIA